MGVPPPSAFMRHGDGREGVRGAHTITATKQKGVRFKLQNTRVRSKIQDDGYPKDTAQRGATVAKIRPLDIKQASRPLILIKKVKTCAGRDVEPFISRLAFASKNLVHCTVLFFLFSIVVPKVSAPASAINSSYSSRTHTYNSHAFLLLKSSFFMHQVPP